jgi:hypothetical protein
MSCFGSLNMLKAFGISKIFELLKRVKLNKRIKLTLKKRDDASFKVVSKYKKSAIKVMKKFKKKSFLRVLKRFFMSKKIIKSGNKKRYEKLKKLTIKV